jgi:N utilization substance protein A
MNAEFFAAIADLEKEKGIPKDYMLDKINQALLAALKKDNPAAAEHCRVDIDESKNKINMYIMKTVVEEVEEPAIELTVQQARRISPTAEVGDIVNVTVETKKFGRIAAQAAKQVIIQGIREAERSIVYEEFTSKEHEILTGVVSRIDPATGSVSIKISSNSRYTEAHMSPGERIPGEPLKEGDRIKVYVVEVRKPQAARRS